MNACKSQPNPKKLLTAQVRHKEVSVCIPFGFAKGTSAKNVDHVTIIDVACEAGVSYTTVSRVLNNKGNVKPKTRERVLIAMTRLGYFVDQYARSLAGGRSQVIRLLVPDMGTSYIGEIIRGVDEEMMALLMRQEKVPNILERFVDSSNAMPRIPTIASAAAGEGYTYPTEVRDVVTREQAEQQQCIEAGRAYASLIQQILHEEAETDDVVLVGRGGQVVLLPFLSVRKEVSYLSQ